MNTTDSRLREREKYVNAFNSTMIKIWKERITMLGVIDTGALLRSVMAVSVSHDQKYTSVQWQQSFRMHGIYVNYGVGSNTPRGNPGDIGRDNRRRKKKWFSRKYYASMMNTREFFADNLGKNMADVISDALSPSLSRRFAQRRNSVF